MCSLGKKDAEGWETVQRGRTAKPRSAALAAKACPVLAHVTPKQDDAKCGQSNRSPLVQQPQRSFIKDTTVTDTKQQVVAEPDPQEKDGLEDSRDVTEVLRFSTSPCVIFLSELSLYKLFRSRVTLDHFTSHICFCFGLGGIHRQTVQTGISTLKRLIVH